MKKLSLCLLPLLVVLNALPVLPAPPTVLRWDLNSRREIAATKNLTNIALQDGVLTATTEYDPYFTLALPADGLDANHYFEISVRLYSSAPSDRLAVYYKSRNGDWCIGASPLTIQSGWQTYTFDARKLVWSRDASSPEARVWGGRDKVITTLRFDPGNAARRQIKVDWIEIKRSGTPDVKTPDAKTPDAKTPSGGATTWVWSKAGDFLGWKPVNFASVTVQSGALRGTTQYDSQLVSPPLKADAAQYGVLEFTAKSSVGGSGEIFFRRAGEGMSGERQIKHTLIGDGKYHTYHVRLDTHPLWTGTIEQIRFDPLNPAGARLELASLRLLPPPSQNLIANGGFEQQELNAPTRPEYWQLAGAGQLAPLAAQGQYSWRAQEKASLTSRRFEFARTGNYQLSFAYRLPPEAVKVLSVRAQLQTFNVFSEPLAEPLADALQVHPTQQWQTFSRAVRVPPRAAYGTLALEVTGELLLDDITLAPLETTTSSSSEETWQASWIIAADAADAAGRDAAPRYFRQTFQLDDPQQVERARVLLSADNTARLWVNGHELPAAPFWDDWKEPDLYDIAPFLRAGQNIIGIETTNQGGPEGMIAEIGIHRRDAEPLFWQTDGSWRATAQPAPRDWAAIGFDDSAWPHAKVVAPKDAPWGELPYTYLGAVTPLRVLSASFDSEGFLGEKKILSLSFVPQQVPSRPLSLTLELARPGERGTVFFSAPLDSAQWKPGRTVQIKALPVPLPRYFAPGEYSLRIRVPYAALETSTPGAEWIEQPFTLKMRGPVQSPVAKVTYLQNGQVPAIEINGQTHTVMHFMTNNAGATILQNVHNSGLQLLWLNLSRGFDWKPDGEPDFSEMDQLISQVLTENPDLYLVLNIPLDPVYNPGMKEWIDLHPGELAKNSKGETRIGGYHGAVVQAPSYASRVWLNDARASLRALIRHVRRSPYGERVIGYVPISGISWEWFYWGAQSREFLDYSEPFRHAFSAWAGEKYGDVAHLNAVWRTNYKSLDEVQIPSEEERRQSDNGVFLDPARSQRLIDLREFFSYVISGDILELCRVVKEETGGGAICGTYYGYVMYVTGPYNEHHTGHFALHRVLQSPDIDFLMSPSRYSDRGMGGGSGFMTAVDSIKLHGKLYIDQIDTRTLNASGAGGQLARLDTLGDSVAELEREFSHTLIGGVAAQFYDFGRGWTGGDARLMELVGRLRQIEAELQKTPRQTQDGRSSIALIVDEKSTFYTRLGSQLTNEAVNFQVETLHRSGVGFDAYLLDDLEKLPPYKVYLFANTFRLTDAQRRFIDEKLKRDGNVLVWIYAPGALDGRPGSTLDFARAAQITGINLQMEKAAGNRVRITNKTSPLTAQIAAPALYGDPKFEGPQLFANDAKSETLGMLDGTQRAGLAMKKFADWTSIYSAAPRLPAALLASIARAGGVPVVNTNHSDVTYVTDRLFAVHTYGGGERTFHVPARSGSVRELLSGREYPVRNGAFSCTLPERSSALFLMPASR